MVFGIMASVLLFCLQFSIFILAIRDLEKKVGNGMRASLPFALCGWMLLFSFLVGILSSFVQIKFFMPTAFADMRENFGPLVLLTYAAAGFVMTFAIAILSITIYGIWRIFTKAGKPGWASIVPIYNAIVQCEIGQRPTWYVFMLFIPLVNIVFAIMMISGISKAFGKDDGFTVGLIFLPFVFYPILGFGPEKWIYGSEPQTVNENLIEDHLVQSA